MAPPTKSKAAKPSVKAGKLPTGAARDAQAAKDKALAKQVVEKRKAGVKYAEIASDLSITVGKAIFLFETATTPTADKITFTTEADLGKKIVAARKQGLSWGKIAARSGVPEGRVKTTWSKVTGQDTLGQSIGKGGRKPNGVPTTKAAKAVKAKAAPAAKTPAAKPAAAKATPTATVKRKIKRRVAV